MGFHIHQIPSVKTLTKKRKELQDDEEFLNWVYSKNNAQTGSIKSFKYLKKIRHERKAADKQHNSKV